jgi:hypothetical protein
MSDQSRKDFARTNLRQCAQELLEWRRTGVLPNGKVKELNRMTEKEFPHGFDQLRITEALIQETALEAFTVNPEQWVVCAANRNRRSGEITLGARHFDHLMHAMNKARKEGQADWVDSEQGFIDQKGNFLTREEALKIAKANGQIRRRCGGDEKRLFSENLY